MADSMAVLEAPALDRDVACVNCGYNLRGLAPGGDCPECGSAVRQSLREDRLADAPLAWLRRVRWGAYVLVAALVLLPVVNLVPAAVLAWGAWAPSMTLVQLGVVLAWGVNLLAVGVGVMGLWLLTAPEPGRAEPATDWRPRAAGRVALLAWAVLTFGVVATVAVSGQRLHGEWWMYDGVLIAAAVIFALGMMACWNHLAVLADRVPAPALVRRLRQLRLDWIAAVGCGILAAAAMNVLNWLAVNAPGGQGAFWQSTGSAAVGGAVAVIGLWLWARTTLGAWGLARTMRTLGGR